MPSIDGIASGIDTTGLINSIVESASIPKLQLEVQLAGYEQKVEALAGMQNRMQDLFDTLEGLADGKELFPSTASATSEAQFTVTADPTATAGAFDVRVHSMASNDLYVSDGFDDRSSLGVIGEGTLKITYGGVDYDIEVDSSNSSLNGVANAINEAIPGLEAFVLDTGAPSERYKLVVAGETGAANAIDIDDKDLKKGGGDKPNFAQQATAADAHVTVNGVDVYSDTDRIDGAIPGLTFDLVAPGDTAVRVSVAKDPEGFEAQVQAFVDAYNDVRSYYDKQKVFNAESGLKGPLAGDSSTRRVMEGLGRTVSNGYSVSSAFDALSQLGISTLQSGKLELDSEVFQQVVADSPSDVLALLTDDSGPFAKLRADIEDVYLDSDNGVLESRKDSVQSSIDTLQDRIDRFDTRMDAYEQRLRERFTAMELALASTQATQSYLAALLPQTSLISEG